MPDYVPDPDHPGQYIDIIELVRRYPDRPPPVNVEGLLRRDLWTRQEALLILCGLAPSNVVHSGLPIGSIGGGIVYLDGIASAQLDALGLQHPRAQAWLPEFMTLAGYAAGQDMSERKGQDMSERKGQDMSERKGQDMSERKAPAEWLAWAESKGFTPYWLDDAAIEDSEEGARRAAGRYTLREAAKEIAKHGRANWENVARRLSEAWASGDLPAYRPGSTVPSTPEESALHRYYMEVYSTDLNVWLAHAMPRIDWRFPEPGPAEPTTVAAPAEQAATIAGPGTIRHSTRGKRRHPLEHAIEPVRDKLPDPNDAAAIFVALEQAGSPFLGKRASNGGWVFEVAEDVNEHTFTLKNLRDYLRSRKR